MNREKLINKIDNINIWRNKDQRAPHKPLLLLYALGQLSKGNERLLRFSNVDKPLEQLLIEFGPYRKTQCSEQPFVRLTNDGIWELKNLDIKYFNNTKKQLLDSDVYGGFTNDVYSLLVEDNKLFYEIAQLLLDKHFPVTLHQEIVRSVDLDFDNNYYIVKRRHRNNEFRKKILNAYDNKCAVCGFNIWLNESLIGVEAAHIKWHNVRGPDSEDNGLALCSMHHKLFDNGVFSIDKSNRIIVSKYARGSSGFDEWVTRYRGKSIYVPINNDYWPKESYIDWHFKEVFKGDGIYLRN